MTPATTLSEKIQRVQRLQVLGILAGGIVHDLNNIFLVVHGYSEHARQVIPGDSPARTDLDKVLTAARRGERMVSQILKFSKQHEHEHRTTDTYSVVQDAVSLLRATLPTTVEIRERLDPHAGIILADDVQIYQVLMNLGINGADAMREHGGTLEVVLDGVTVDEELAATLGDVTPGPHAHIAVSDTGHGMDAATLRRIYDTFFTTKYDDGGTGLGLAVVRSIVQGHKGAISVTSEPGKGTTFDLYFPQIEEKIPVAVEGTAVVRGGQERILVVDDAPELVRLAEQALTRLGYTVDGVTNSKKALALLRDGTRTFDLVVADQTMPQVTGLEMAMALRESRSDIPVILTTGFSAALTPESLASAGISAVIMKPYHEQELGRAVRAALDHRHLLGPQRQTSQPQGAAAR